MASGPLLLVPQPTRTHSSNHPRYRVLLNHSDTQGFFAQWRVKRAVCAAHFSSAHHLIKSQGKFYNSSTIITTWHHGICCKNLPDLSKCNIFYLSLHTCRQMSTFYSKLTLVRSLDQVYDSNIRPRNFRESGSDRQRTLIPPCNNNNNSSTRTSFETELKTFPEDHFCSWTRFLKESCCFFFCLRKIKIKTNRQRLYIFHLLQGSHIVRQDAVLPPFFSLSVWFPSWRRTAATPPTWLTVQWLDEQKGKTFFTLFLIKRRNIFRSSSTSSHSGPLHTSRAFPPATNASSEPNTFNFPGWSSLASWFEVASEIH